MKVLILDDEKGVGQWIQEVLKDQDISSVYVSDFLGLKASFENFMPGAVLLDVYLNQALVDGLKILEFLKTTYPSVPVIMMSHGSTPEVGISSLEAGAFDLLEKPLSKPLLLAAVGRALTFHDTCVQLENARKFARAWGVYDWALAPSKKMRGAWRSVRKSAKGKASILLVGEPGVGKKNIARYIFQVSSPSCPFCYVDCRQFLPGDPYESLWVGEETPEGHIIPGYLEQAGHGALVLDHVDFMPLSLQGFLLKYLESKKVTRLGGEENVCINPRVIALSSSPLDPLVESGQFLPSLRDRIGIIPIEIPSLRERKEDIDFFVDQFLKELSKRTGREVTVHPSVLASMKLYHWPGNISELKGTLEHMARLASQEDFCLTLDMLPQRYRYGWAVEPGPDQGQEDVFSYPLRKARRIFERHYLKAQLSRFNGSVARAAPFIGMERTALHRKLKILK